jgi:hypothetical protein
MRLFFVLLALHVTIGSVLAGDLPATAAAPEEPPAPLAAALQKLMADEGHWAYTQTTQVFDRDGLPKEGLQVERYDPSQPEDQQWTLVLKKGRPPTGREVHSWKKKKAREMRRREDKPLGEVLDINRAQVNREEGPELVYEIPLQQSASRRFPAEKFVVFMTVNRARLTLEHFGLKTRESFRMAGVAKIEQVEIDASFATVDEKYAPQPREITAHGAGKVLFFRVGARAEIKWTDFKRVTPYNDRFVVKLGELKVLDF